MERANESLALYNAASHANVVDNPITVAPGVQVRRIEQSDIPAMMHLDRILFPVVYDAQFYAQFFMAQNARRYCALAAFDDDTGELIGVCTCRLVIVSKSLFSSEPQLYIMTLGVHPSYRRRHIAESMLRMVSEWFEFHHSCTTVYLHVLSTNEQAVAFYRRCGFKCVTTLKRYYVLDGVHHDALVMEKQLHLGASYSLISSIRHALESLLCLSTDDTP